DVAAGLFDRLDLLNFADGLHLLDGQELSRAPWDMIEAQRNSYSLRDHFVMTRKTSGGGFVVRRRDDKKAVSAGILRQTRELDALLAVVVAGACHNTDARSEHRAGVADQGKFLLYRERRRFSGGAGNHDPGDFRFLRHLK